jgi:hypothetical protein
MTLYSQRFSSRARAAGVALAALASVVAPLAAPTQAVASVSRAEAVTALVTIKSVDHATRHLVVTGPSGEEVAIKVPPDIRNFDQLKPGDKINATYTIEVEIALSPPNAPLSKDSITRVETRSTKGAMPGGSVANHIIVTGAVVGIDNVHHTLKLVSPQGGEVHTVLVTDPEGLKAMAHLKVGDKITAYVTESLLIATHPA